MSQTVSVRLDDETLKKLDLMAKAADRSRAWLMSQAVKQYVDHEAWQLDAIKKSLEKLESGKARFADHANVAHWLSSWGSDTEAERPQCK
jgi:predicted transcriptional regulator